MCLQVFFEGRWSLCRGDIRRRQAIPDSRCRHSEDSIADCFQSGTPNNQFVTRRRSESPSWLVTVSSERIGTQLMVNNKSITSVLLVALRLIRGLTERARKLTRSSTEWLDRRVCIELHCWMVELLKLLLNVLGTLRLSLHCSITSELNGKQEQSYRPNRNHTCFVCL